MIFKMLPEHKKGFFRPTIFKTEKPSSDDNQLKVRRIGDCNLPYWYRYKINISFGLNDVDIDLSPKRSIKYDLL